MAFKMKKWHNYLKWNRYVFAEGGLASFLFSECDGHVTGAGKNQNVSFPGSPRKSKKNVMPDHVRHDGNCKTIIETRY
jgi:hypothetical protein